MNILFWGLSIFISVFILHCVVWRVVTPVSAIKWLLIFFVSLWVVWLLVFLNFSFEVKVFDVSTPQKLSEYFHIASLYWALALTYILFYQALIEPGPSCSMVMLVSRAGKEGVDKKAFNEIVNDNTLIKPRVEYLVKNKLTFVNDGKYCLTRKGSCFVGIFAFYRNLVRLKKYGG